MIAKSTTFALLLAGSYGVVAVAYIVVSSHLAASVSTDVAEMARIETIKGIVYVAVTTLAVFLGGLIAMRRMERDAGELLRRERALVATQGRVFAGVMAASVAHDANNVLTAVLGDLDDLAATARSADAVAAVGHLRTSIGRLVELNRRLLSAQKLGAPRELQLVDLPRLVRDCVASVRAHKSLLQARVVCRGVESLPVRTQPVLVHQIVSNLVLNAGEATGGRGLVEIQVHDDGERAVVEVHDDGPGVPMERRASLFDALASTKSGGSGLGLFSVRACVQGLGGLVSVADSPLGGACFRVELPAEPAAVAV